MTVLALARDRPAPFRIAALGAIGVVGDVAFDPVHRHVPLCPFHAITGAYCPLCGGLRAVDSLVHLNLTAALHDNALFVGAVPVLLVWWADWVVRVRTGRTARVPKRYAVAALVVLVVVFAVVRNLPFASALRPT